VFQIWEAFATAQQTAEMRVAFEEGIAWGEAKKQLFELIDAELAPARERYLELMENPEYIEEELRKGAERARRVAAETMDKVRAAVGIGAIR
jgi:tryptophanyl-tRNA synthetase